MSAPIVEGSAPAGPAADDRVYLATPQRGIPMHRMPTAQGNTGCERSTRTGVTMRAAEAVEHFGSKPCQRKGCWPGGGAR